MKKFWYATPAALVTALAVASSSSALAPKKIPFTGSYSGQASTLVDGQTATISANGTGKGTLIGAGTIVGQGTGDASQQPCVPFGGTGKLTGTAGTTVTYKLATGANSCGDEGGHIFSVKGYMVVIKATGKLAKAKGTIKFTGTYSHDDGSFSIKLAGLLKK